LKRRRKNDYNVVVSNEIAHWAIGIMEILSYWFNPISDNYQTTEKLTSVQ